MSFKLNTQATDLAEMLNTDRETIKSILKYFTASLEKECSTFYLNAFSKVKESIDNNTVNDKQSLIQVLIDNLLKTDNSVSRIAVSMNKTLEHFTWLPSELIMFVLEIDFIKRVEKEITLQILESLRTVVNDLDTYEELDNMLQSMGIGAPIKE